MLLETVKAVYLWRNFVDETGLLGHEGPLRLLGLLLLLPRLASGGDGGWRPGVTERVGHGGHSDGGLRSGSSQLLYCYDKLRITGPRISCP